MKHILFLLFSVFFILSCASDSSCVLCELAGTNDKASQELCQEGSDLAVSKNIIKIKTDTLLRNTTLASYQSKLQGLGYTCK
jgi:hypothetical protein